MNIEELQHKYQIKIYLGKDKTSFIKNLVTNDEVRFTKNQYEFPYNGFKGIMVAYNYAPPHLFDDFYTVDVIETSRPKNVFADDWTKCRHYEQISSVAPPPKDGYDLLNKVQYGYVPSYSERVDGEYSIKYFYLYGKVKPKKIIDVDVVLELYSFNGYNYVSCGGLYNGEFVNPLDGFQSTSEKIRVTKMELVTDYINNEIFHYQILNCENI